MNKMSCHGWAWYLAKKISSNLDNLSYQLLFMNEQKLEVKEEKKVWVPQKL